MKILVTGARGQLGRELHEAIESAAPDMTIYTDAVADDDAGITMLDITDVKAVEKFVLDNDVTHIINCAAYTDVDKAEEQKLECMSVNFTGVSNIARAADISGAKVIHISTDYVFDGRTHRPYTEADKVNPISEYGTSKRKGETALIAMAPDSIIIRTAWLYSPHGRNFVRTILGKLRSGQPLDVVCDHVGTPTYARDLAHAIVRVLQAKQWVSGIFHYTNEGAISWYDFAKAIARLSGHSDACIRPVNSDDYPTAASRPYYSVLDRTRIKVSYGVVIPYWEESLKHCINRIKS